VSDPSPHDLEALLRQFQASDARELHVRTATLELFLSKDPAAPAPWGGGGGAASPTSTAAPPSLSSGAERQSEMAAPAAAAETFPEHWTILRAPYLGTFYRAPKPGEPNFVEIGEPVAAGRDLCLVEVMKLFTAVCAESAGTIRAILADDGQMVEEGQPLFAIEPAGA
jgi:acetyl-CoA carboxylase biotin carboxyl carrier protein